MIKINCSFISAGLLLAALLLWVMPGCGSPQNGELSSVIQSLEDQVAETNKSLSILVAKLDKMNKEGLQYQQELEALQKELGQLRQEIDRLQKKLEEKGF